MKVKELIEKLKELDGEMQVIVPLEIKIQDDIMIKFLTPVELRISSFFPSSAPNNSVIIEAR